MALCSNRPEGFVSDMILQYFDAVLTIHSRVLYLTSTVIALHPVSSTLYSFHFARGYIFYPS